MIDALTQPFAEFAFMRRALIGCLALSLSAPPIGVFLVLRRMSLMGDVMGHAILPGAAIGKPLLRLDTASAGDLGRAPCHTKLQTRRWRVRPGDGGDSP